MAKMIEGGSMISKLHSEGKRSCMKDEKEPAIFCEKTVKRVFRRHLKDIKFTTKGDFIIFERHGKKFYFNRNSSFLLNSNVDIHLDEFTSKLFESAGSVSFYVETNGMKYSFVKYNISKEFKDKGYDISRIATPIFIKWFENIIFGEETLGISNN